MKIIYYSKKYIISNCTDFENSINKTFNEIIPLSLKEIIITSSNHNEYMIYVNKYDEACNVTNSNDYQGAAITISKLSNDSLVQYIVLKDFYFFNAINCLYDGIIEKITDENREKYSYFLGGLFHEIGHTRDYDIRFNLYNKRPSSKSDYNLLVKEERDVFFMHEASTLWSEFIAQYFSEIMLNQNDSYNISELNTQIKK
jgi:hypothetical protein